MKQNLTLCAVIVMFMASLVGCGNQALNTNPSENNANGTSNVSPALTDANGHQQSNEEVFYGEWVIHQVLAFAPVSTYSTEDMESILNKEIVFSEERAASFGDRLEYLNNVLLNPEYEQAIISKADFEQNSRVTFEQLGVAGEEITEVTASDKDKNRTIFFVKDANTLILTGGGVFLELIRK